MSVETYYNQFKSSGDKAVDEEKKKKLEEAEARKEQIGQNLDASAGLAAGVYEQEIRQAPLDSRALYDQNAMQEAVNRKKIGETLANMGMTDSGLSSSMHTALAVQKSRGDNAVRAEEQQRIRTAEATIDQIWASTHLQKAEEYNTIDQSVADWEHDARLSVETNAQQQAAAAYKADVEAQTEANKMALDYQNKRASMAQSLLGKGFSDSEAWGQAYAAYPDTSSDEGKQYAYYNQLKNAGYGEEYATAMTRAYVSATKAQATEEEVNQAVAAAMWKVAGDPSDTTLLRAGAEDIPNIGEHAYDYFEYYKSTGLPDADAAYATAIRIGSLYASVVVGGDDATANEVGQMLAQCFSGNNLDVALYYAGLE